MKVPKGWPTEEMVRAGMNAPTQGHPETGGSSIIDIFIAMYEAAPTPPAPAMRPCSAPHRSHECKDCGLVIEYETPPARDERFGVAAMIMRDVCELPQDDPEDPQTICINADTLQRIIGEHLTPPAQEAEPIGLSSFFRWCHPGDRQEQRWLLMFDDKDRGYNVYEAESDAIRDFNRAEGLGWNCHLFTSVPRIPDPATPAQEAEPHVLSKMYLAAARERDELKKAAQEAEPVASLHVSRFRGHLENTQFEYLGDLPDGTYKLYTHAPSDKMRLAARELLAKYDSAHSRRSFHIAEGLEKLRAELEGKS